MLRTLATLAALTLAIAAPAVLACGGDHANTTAQVSTTPQTVVVAAQTEKAAPAQKSDQKAEKQEAFKLLGVKEVDTALTTAKADAKKPVAVFDANSKSTREKMGVIPTAVLLPSASDYDVALLPKDKATPVVFYCANERCTASHTAAKRAVAEGHTDVAVLAPGIKGWVEAGKSVTKG